MKNSILFLLVASFILVQCKNASTPANVLNDLESKLAEEPNPTNANNVVKEINRLLTENKNDLVGNKALIEKGMEICKTHNLKSKTGSFITMYLRSYGNEIDKKEYILELSKLMIANNRDKAGNILLKSFVDLYPNDARAAEQKTKIESVVGQDVNAYLLKLAESIFENPDQFGMNRKNSSQYVNACEAYALAYGDEKSPEYLYKAAEIARSLRTFPKTLSLYDWIIDSYPNYEKASTTLFLKGFVIENDLENDELAKEAYDSFLKKYPNDDLADDVQFLLDNLGKSNEEILKLIEQGKTESQVQ